MRQKKIVEKIKKIIFCCGHVFLDHPVCDLKARENLRLILLEIYYKKVYNKMRMLQRMIVRVFVVSAIRKRF